MSQKVIDGEVLEGGGQILRIAVALGCLLEVPIKVENIRAKRNKPGLRPQHLTGIQLIREICDGKLSGAVVGSTEITFEPSSINSGTFYADTKTAGSVGLLIQVALPCLIFGPDRSHGSLLHLKGGTNAEMAPPIDFFEEVFIPTVKKFGIEMKTSVIRRGFYPKGGGEVEVNVNPVTKLHAVQITDCGTVSSIRGRAYVAGSLPMKVANVMARTAQKILEKSLPTASINIVSERIPDRESFGTGCGIMITATTTTGCLLSGSAIGRKGIPSETVGATAAEALLRNIENEACVDEHLQDQLIIFMALAHGKSSIRTGPITLHTKTAIYMAERMTEAKFVTTNLKDKGDDQGTFLIECTGIGFNR